MAEVRFHQAVPILCVGALERATAFYEQLGFTVEALYPGSYALLQCDGVALHLRVAGPGEGVTPEENPCGAYFFVTGVDAFATRASGQRIEILEPPTNRPYRVRECSISDPDGNLLRFGELLQTKVGGAGRLRRSIV